MQRHNQTKRTFANVLKTLYLNTLIRRILQSSSNRLKSIWISCSPHFWPKNQFFGGKDETEQL